MFECLTSTTTKSPKQIKKRIWVILSELSYIKTTWRHFLTGLVGPDFPNDESCDSVPGGQL